MSGLILASSYHSISTEGKRIDRRSCPTLWCALRTEVNRGSTLRESVLYFCFSRYEQESYLHRTIALISFKPATKVCDVRSALLAALDTTNNTMQRPRRRMGGVIIATLLVRAATLLPSAVLVASSSSSSSSSGSINSLCWRGSSEYEMELVFCNHEARLDVDVEWYCFKSEICQDWKSVKRRCPIVKGCATADNCTTSTGDPLQGEAQTSAALSIKTWCSLAETSEDYSALALRTPSNGATSALNMPDVCASKWVILTLAVAFSAFASLAASITSTL